MKDLIDQYSSTLLNVIEYELNEDEILFDQYVNHRVPSCLSTSPKFISDLRWMDQLRQRIQQQIEPLKSIDLK